MTRRLVAVLLGLWLLVVCPALAHVGLDDQIKELDARILKEPRAADLYLRRGELHDTLGDLESALQDYERARDLEPHSAEAAFHIGRAMLQAGRPADAILALDRAQMTSGHPDAQAIRARALAGLGRRLEAAGEFTRAIGAYGDPRLPPPDLYLERATVLAAAGPGYLAEALRGLDEGMTRLGPAVSLELAAIDLEVRLGRHEAALARVETIALGSRTQGRWLALRGEILMAAGRAVEARAAYDAALASIRALPERRRSSGAVAALEETIRHALERLEAGR